MTEQRIKAFHLHSAATAVAVLSLLGLVCSALVTERAQAAFESVGCFAGKEGTPAQACEPFTEAEMKQRKEEGKEEFPEEVQLGGVGGMAVNYTGAGGVEPGTVYAMTETLDKAPSVLMFTPGADGGLQFATAWGVRANEKEPYLRCGPLLGTACKGAIGALARPVDIDVDQETGEVFAYFGPIEAGRKAIVAYTPDGSEEITRFGEIAPNGDTFSDSPEKIHYGRYPGEIAVNSAGDVFVYDLDINALNGQGEERLAKFVPKVPGDPSAYEYAGTSEDVQVNGKHPVSDAAGNLYVASDKSIEFYDPNHPSDPPVCSFVYKKAGIQSITVDPLSGHVFFYSSRVEAGFKTKTIHELGPCNPVSGKFEGPKGEEEIGQVEVKPERQLVSTLAFDPVRSVESGRPAGTLYAAAPDGSNGIDVGEKGQASLGYIFAHPPESPPSVSKETVSGMRSTSARLQATVDPKPFDTRYVFQYLTSSDYQAAGESFTGGAEAPFGGAIVPGGSGPQAVGVSLTGLSPETEYVFRVLATNHGCPVEPVEELCSTSGAVKSLRTYPEVPAGLLDHRAYELVSPPHKGGGEVFPANPHINSCGSEVECKPGGLTTRFPLQSTADGDAIAYEGTPFGPGGAASANAYIARRDPLAGWQSANPTPVAMGAKAGQGYRSYNQSLTEAIFAPDRGEAPPSALAPAGFFNLYPQPTASPFPFGDPALLAEPPSRSNSEFVLNYAGASADLTRVFFAANDALTGPSASAPEALEGGASKFNLYEWDRSSGEIHLLNVAPGNAATAPGASFGASGAGSSNAISADGSRVFWSGESGQLFVREDGTLTREIPGSGPTAKFLAAATDGSSALLSNGTLYDLEDEASTDLTDGEGGFLGLAGQSEDLSHLYFLDSAVLTGTEEACRRPNLGEGEICESALDGQPNLYEWSAGTTRFIARLLPVDNLGGSRALTHTWLAAPSKRTAEASPDGRYLAFQSQAPLSGADNTGPCETDHFGGYIPAPCPEVYLFDSQSGELSCPSCNPSGAAPQGWSLLPLVQGDQWIPQARYLTDSGRLYFDSQDSLSPFDTNQGVEDVYEFEPQGAGTCERPAGCLSLISAGHEPTDSNFLAINRGTPDRDAGSDVFFTSRDQLVLKDKDDLIDLYDAREGGGIASETELPAPVCQGEACQPPLAPPALPTPATSVPAGDGNLEEAPAKPGPCPKGKVKKSGKCVKKKGSKKRAKHQRRAHR